MTRTRWWVLAGGCVVAAVLLVPGAPRAMRVIESLRRQAAIRAAKEALARGADGLPEEALVILPDGDGDPDSPDDAQIRSLALQAEVGPRPGWAMAQVMREAALDRAKWAGVAAAPPGVSSPGTRAWTSLGPLAARSEFNGTYYKALDSGRLTAIALDPSNPSGIFIASATGGIWHAPDANGSYPTWTPVTDNLGSLATGAIAISPVVVGTAVTLWVGLGEVFDQAGGQVVRGTFDTATNTAIWGTPIPLATNAHPADGLPSSANDVRDVKLDPNDTNVILVSTNEGLYRSTDGGGTFNVVDLPNGAFGPTREATWNIVYLGTDTGTGKSAWVVSGVYGCPTRPGAKAGTSPPDRGQGVAACPLDATKWSAGDVWKSVDGGATWTSARGSGGFPAQVVSVQGFDPGRIELGAGAPTGSTSTVIYAEAAASYEGSGPSTAPGCTGTCSLVVATAWILKSTDGGSTWTLLGSGLSGGRAGVTTATPVQNPTTLGTDCTTVDAGHGQSWYNLAVGVDPQNPNRAIFGGNLCGIVTVDGGATFRNGAHWLPQSGLGFTGHGFLPYVHADWHVARAAVDPVTGRTVLYVGTDGGFFVSFDIWDVANPEMGSWLQPDVGLATHQFYGIGTGDPSLGNPNTLFGGLQDNGTRWRLVSDESFIAEFNLANWDQVVGGDGVAGAVATDTKGQNPIYWTALPGARRACFPKVRTCSQATRIENGVELSNWSGFSLGVTEPFLIRYDTLDDDSSGIASASTSQANLFFPVNAFGTTVSVRNVVPNNGVVVDGSVRSFRGTGLRVSPFRYTIDGVAGTRIYGGVTTSGATGLGSYLVIDKPGVGSTLINAVHGVSIPGVTGIGTGTMWIGNGSDIAMPQNPASLGGNDSKKTWLVSTNSVLSNPVNCADPTSATCDPALFIPPAVGHLFKTIDGGATWTPFHGNGTGFDLPDVPIWIVRYDPSDPTDQTLWVGTDFGIYRSTDGGNTWAPYGKGLPSVRVWDIRIARNGSPVRIATYGRGAWEIFPNSEPPTAAGNGDFDRTQVIDFFDLASLAARMGSTPATTNNLVYDGISDLDGSGTLDEADLGLLLAKFGSAP